MEKKALSFLLCFVMISGFFLLRLPNKVSADTSLMLWYKFNETSGTTVTDSSGFERNGTLNGGATWQGGSGVLLDGNSGYVQMPNGILSGLNSVTVGVRVLVDSAASYPTWVFTFGSTTDSYADADANYFGLLLNQAKYRISLSKTHWVNEQNTGVESGFKTGEWKYVTYTQTGTTGKLYVDGVQVAQNTSVGITPNDIESTVANFIGRAPYLQDKYFKGKLSDFRIYNRALSASEVLEISNYKTDDKSVLEAAKAQLAIHNADDVRGNITLPVTIIADGEAVNISWSSNKPDVISVKETVIANYGKIPPGVVTRQSTDTQVTLTANLTRGTEKATIDIPVKVKAKPIPLSESDFKGYFFTYFNGSNRSDAEQIYFSLSKDGLTWTEINKNNPVLTSTVGDKGVRDPFILRSPEGDKFYMVATDLRIANGAGWSAAQKSGSKSVVVWESNDLVNWSKERLVKVSRDDAGCTWAPEIVYDDKTGEYVMFWASRIAADNYAKQRIYISKTRDFCSFTTPEVWIDKSQDVIDATLIKHNNIYYRFSKDEVNKNIIVDKCDQLLYKTYDAITSTSVGSQNGVEGPTIFKFNGQNKWCLLLDNYGGGGYFPMVSTDISTGVFTKLATSEYKLPSVPRHGTVMQITQAEYDAVMAKWGEGSQQTQTNITIKGYVKPDFNCTNPSNVLANFKIEVEGTLYSAITDQKGSFEIQGVPKSSKPYTLKISKKNYLTREISGIVTDISATQVEVSTLQRAIDMWSGDMEINGNQDDTINMLDIIKLATIFNSIKGDERFIEEADFNNDESINMADIIIVAKHFNCISSNYPEF